MSVCLQKQQFCMYNVHSQLDMEYFNRFLEVMKILENDSFQIQWQDFGNLAVSTFKSPVKIIHRIVCFWYFN